MFHIPYPLTRLYSSRCHLPLLTCPRLYPTASFLFIFFFFSHSKVPTRPGPAWRLAANHNPKPILVARPFLCYTALLTSKVLTD